MDEDVIIVDDEPHAGRLDTNANGTINSASTHRRPQTIAETVLRTSARRRSTPPVAVGSTDRTTRSANAKAKAQPKLKLKLSDKAAAQAAGTSFLGSYDRELDSDDEDLAFEEQFILRMPPGEDCEKLRKVVAAREVSNDVWFKFKDSRRAIFHVGNTTYSAKLVDLPCVIESQKTLDNRQMFKVADICQMLVVEHRIDSEEATSNQKSFNIDEFIWPHGITPPLHHVRKRRFRKRVNRRTIETVEQEVERLLEADAQAMQVQYDILDNVNPDLSDSEFIEQENTANGGALGSDGGDAPTPGPGTQGDDNDDDDDDDDEGDIDEELAAELDLALGDDDGEGEEDEDEQSEEDDEDEDEDDEAVQARRLLNEEISDLEAAVAKKGHEITSSANPLIKRRFEDALKKLQADLDMKLAQRDELKEQQRLRIAGITQREDSEPNEEYVADLEDNLFGVGDPVVEMDIG